MSPEVRRNNSGCSGCIVIPIPIGCALFTILIPVGIIIFLLSH